MFLDFEDHRPETPRVPSAVSTRTAVEVSLGLHVLFALGLVFLPGRFAVAEPDRAVIMPPPQEDARFVFMQPPVERPAPPRPRAEASDLDRRATTIERPEEALLESPISRGNTREKVVGAPEERLAGPESPTPAPPSPFAAPSRPPENGLAVLPEPPPQPPAPPAGGRLGQSLRDLQRYLQQENFDNPQGGFTDTGPDIQFDSRGVEFGPWLRRFVAQVKSNWFVPQVAGIVGDRRVVLQFNVHKNGGITDLRVLTGADIDAFNLSSFNAIKLSNPTLPLPPEFPDAKAFFTVIFHYERRR